jgi:hypothetical protein
LRKIRKKSFSDVRTLISRSFVLLDAGGTCLKEKTFMEREVGIQTSKNKNILSDFGIAGFHGNGRSSDIGGAGGKCADRNCTGDLFI